MEKNIEVFRISILTSLAMIAFAANSVLCRLALADAAIDAASFTFIRIVSGAVTLTLLVGLQRKSVKFKGSWLSSFALFGYAAGFSFAYVHLPTGVGALLLFGTVQLTMITYGIIKGERLSSIQIFGFLIAAIGLIILFMPGINTPPFFSSSLMVVAGVSWGVYSLRGRGIQNPLEETTGNFVRATAPCIFISSVFIAQTDVGLKGVIYAVLSGAIASGLGYAVWYSVLPFLRSTTAATVQLTVPIIAAAGGVVVLNEEFTTRLIVAGLLTLGGVAIFIKTKP